MNRENEHQLMKLLEESFNPDGDMHFLAVAATLMDSPASHEHPLYKVRVSLTYQENGAAAPYFDGTDLCVALSPDGITLAQENEWSDGPPIMEGSPIELALGWVTELATPFHVSKDALKAAELAKSQAPTSPPPDSTETDFHDTSNHF